MKTIRLLRMLSLLGFLLLLAPFYDSCEDKNNGFVKTYNEYDLNGKLIEKTLFQKTYNIVVDELSFNGFEIASFFVYGIQDVTFKEIQDQTIKSFQKKGWYKDSGIYISFLFDFIVLISFSLLILSFFKKQSLYTKMALTNCILIMITFCYIIFLERSFEYWHQIKWGYYAFIITNLLIFYYSKTNKSQT